MSPENGPRNWGRSGPYLPGRYGTRVRDRDDERPQYARCRSPLAARSGRKLPLPPHQAESGVDALEGLAVRRACTTTVVRREALAATGWAVFIIIFDMA